MVSRCVKGRVKSTSLSYNPTVAALCFPKITERLQAELDSVVGRDRMPTFDDERSLPFLNAFIKEVTRCVFIPSIDPFLSELWQFCIPDGVL